MLIYSPSVIKCPSLVLLGNVIKFFICPTSSPKLKDIQVTMIQNKQQQILTVAVEKQKPESVWHFAAGFHIQIVM